MCVLTIYMMYGSNNWPMFLYIMGEHDSLALCRCNLLVAKTGVRSL